MNEDTKNKEDKEPVINEGQDEMSTEEKAVQYDVLKNEFSNLQGRFEGLAKILGSHGIDIGGESLQPAQPSTSQQAFPAPADADPAYYPPVQGYVVPKQEPAHGWDYNHQWMQQYPPYPQPQAYHNSYPYPYLPQTYNLPYPPPDHPIYPIPHHTTYPPVHQEQSLPPPHPVDQGTLGNQPSSKPSKAKINQKRTSKSKNYLNNKILEPSKPVDEAAKQNFMGDMVAPKKSFQGPSSNKLKRKSDPMPPAAAQPSTPSLIQNTPQGPSGPKQSRVQTLYPPSQQAVPTKNTRRKSMPIKLKPGAHPVPGTNLKPGTQLKPGTHPKPFSKTVPLHEQSLQANNPFRQNKKAVPSRVQPQVQTLFPPREMPGPRPEVEIVSTERRRSLPSLGSGITIQKVLNPLENPNKPQELKKVLAMSNLSVSLTRK